MSAPVAVASEASLRLPRTPGLPLGPFYPVQRRAPGGAALWMSAEWPARTRRLLLQGRVMDAAGRALQGAVVEIWHADPEGRYRHASEPGFNAMNALFAGYGAQTTDRAGAWRFVSLMPGGYGAESGPRAPHVHFQVTHGERRLVTQMFFPDQAMNASDRWYRAVAHPERLLGQVKDDGIQGRTVTWDIVMDSASNA